MHEFSIGRTQDFQPNFEKIQFIFLSQISQSTNKLKMWTRNIRENLYKNKKCIKECLLSLAWSIENTNTEDLLFLNLKYFMEILNNPDFSDILSEINKNEDLKEMIFSKIMTIKDRSFLHEFLGESQNRDHGKTASVNILHSKINLWDEILELFGNFISQIGTKYSWIWSGKKVKNERPTIEELKLKSKKVTYNYNEWDPKVCVIDKEYLTIDREDHIKFGYWLYKKIKSLVVSSHKPPNSIFYSIWKLEYYLLSVSKMFSFNF